MATSSDMDSLMRTAAVGVHMTSLRYNSGGAGHEVEAEVPEALCEEATNRAAELSGADEPIASGAIASPVRGV